MVMHLQYNPKAVGFLRLDNIGLKIGDCFVSTTGITLVFYACVTAAAEVVGSHVCVLYKFRWVKR